MLTFDPATHSYFWNGKKVPNVTSVLDAVIDTTFMNEAGRERGNIVHKLTQGIDEQTLDALAPVKPAWSGYLKGYCAFKESCRPKWDAIEQRVFHKVHHYAGCADRIGTLWPDSEREESVWLDIKTGQPHAATALQISAYVEADSPGTAEPNRYALYLREDGTWRPIKCKTRHREYFSVYLSLLTLYRWREKHDL